MPSRDAEHPQADRPVVAPLASAAGARLRSPIPTTNSEIGPHFRCSQGNCSLRKKCFDGSNLPGSSKAPTWKCVSFFNWLLSHVSVEPQVRQKPRVVPGEDLNFAISPFVTVYAWKSKPTKTETGAPLCRRQLWQ
jgi:hypothetical protein